jgi:glutathione S-transferase
MDDLLAQPALRAWALSSVVVALKTMAVGVYTSSIRIRRNVYISPEDYAVQGLPPAAGADADVERARRMHRNDLENHLPFALVGLVYALTGPTTAGLWICFAGFPLARIAHSITYARGLMPHRTIAFGVGFLITLWMALSSLVALL